MRRSHVRPNRPRTVAAARSVYAVVPAGYRVVERGEFMDKYVPQLTQRTLTACSADDIAREAYAIAADLVRDGCGPALFATVFAPLGQSWSPDGAERVRERLADSTDPWDIGAMYGTALGLVRNGFRWEEAA